MYEHCESDDSHISLHDCIAARIAFENDILSFVFPDGFWVTSDHPENESDDVVRTTSSQVDFHVEGLWDIHTYIFRESEDEKVIREDWEPRDFMRSVNNGAIHVEFIDEYKAYRSYLYKCITGLKWTPRLSSSDCEIIIHSDEIAYHWNRLRYDSIR